MQSKGRGRPRELRSRDDIDIRGSRANAEERARRREEEYGAPLDWLDSLGVQRGLVARYECGVISALLVEFVQAQFRRGASLTKVKQAIFGVSDVHPVTPTDLRRVWATVSNWERQ